MLDAATPFWDIRPNPRLPTLEIRSMDVVADIDDSVALAMLVRAIVAASADKARAGDVGPRPSSELLRAAYWRAARDGWCGCGVDSITGRVLPAAVQAARLLDHIGPTLHRHGDSEIVHGFVARLAARGAGAERQRACRIAAFAVGLHLARVVRVDVADGDGGVNDRAAGWIEHLPADLSAVGGRLRVRGRDPGDLLWPR